MLEASNKTNFELNVNQNKKALKPNAGSDWSARARTSRWSRDRRLATCLFSNSIFGKSAFVSGRSRCLCRNTNAALNVSTPSSLVSTVFIKTDCWLNSGQKSTLILIQPATGEKSKLKFGQKTDHRRSQLLMVGKMTRITVPRFCVLLRYMKFCCDRISRMGSGGLWVKSVIIITLLTTTVHYVHIRLNCIPRRVCQW